MWKGLQGVVIFTARCNVCVWVGVHVHMHCAWLHLFLMSSISNDESVIKV